MIVCKSCGEAEHVYSCNKPPFVSSEEWSRLTDDERLAAEETAEQRGYVWTEGAGWVNTGKVRP